MYSTITRWKPLRIFHFSNSSLFLTLQTYFKYFQNTLILQPFQPPLQQLIKNIAREQEILDDFKNDFKS